MARKNNRHETKTSRNPQKLSTTPDTNPNKSITCRCMKRLNFCRFLLLYNVLLFATRLFCISVITYFIPCTICHFLLLYFVCYCRVYVVVIAPKSLLNCSTTKTNKRTNMDRHSGRPQTAFQNTYTSVYIHSYIDIFDTSCSKSKPRNTQYIVVCLLN